MLGRGEKLSFLTLGIHNTIRLHIWIPQALPFLLFLSQSDFMESADRKCRVTHPDKTHTDTNLAFIRLREAYELLSSPVPSGQGKRWECVPSKVFPRDPFSLLPPAYVCGYWTNSRCLCCRMHTREHVVLQIA